MQSFKSLAVRASGRMFAGPSSRFMSTYARQMWREADAVCFDVDSTVCMEEGIDVLADSLGVGQDVANLTTKAMEGGMGYADSLAARLTLMKPSRANVDECLAKHPPRLSPKIDVLINTLHKKGKQVWLVSGGFRQLIEPVATTLGVSHDRLVANVLLFDGKGDHAGFDRDQPTSKTGGKALVVERLVNELGLTKVVMVGDGATDMEARPPAVAFVGYGGVVTRTKVKEGADWFVTDFQDLIDELEK
jgi:phosphoserine phosphatase